MSRVTFDVLGALETPKCIIESIANWKYSCLGNMAAPRRNRMFLRALCLLGNDGDEQPPHREITFLFVPCSSIDLRQMTSLSFYFYLLLVLLYC